MRESGGSIPLSATEVCVTVKNTQSKLIDMQNLHVKKGGNMYNIEI